MLLNLLAACGGDETVEGGQKAQNVEDTGSSGAPCTDTITVVDEADAGLGFSASDVLLAAGRPPPTSFRYVDATITTVTLLAGIGGEVRRVDRVDNPGYDATGDTGTTKCTSYLDFDGTVTFSTEDGVLVGVAVGTLSAESADGMTVRASAAGQSLTGTYAPPADEVASGDPWTLSFGGAFTAVSTTGAVTGRGTGGPDTGATGSAAAWQIGSWK
jgi:hypothetical protein